MKKFIFIIFIIPSFAFASFDHDLYYGLKKDTSVSELQEFLTDQGFYSGSITGNFFSLTLAAVKRFQVAKLIFPISGYFGPKSRNKANEILITAGIFDSSVTTEEGTIIQATTSLPKTTNDVVSSLIEQTNVLKSQIQTLQEQNQKLQTIQQEQIKQTQVLGQIQMNTTLAPNPPIQLPPPLNPRFLNDPKVSSQRFLSANSGWEISFSIDFADVPYVGAICRNPSNPGEPEYRRNRITKQLSFLIPNDGFSWNTTYSCTIFLQDWIEGRINEIKSLPITKNISFTTPVKPL